jgi:hypothetical protein
MREMGKTVEGWHKRGSDNNNRANSLWQQNKIKFFHTRYWVKCWQKKILF